MLNSYWKQFKSGTDIRGVASSGVENEEINLSNEVISKIALGFVSWLCKCQNKEASDISISIGHDSRISANRIKDVLISSIGSVGTNIYDCDLASTPAMFMSILDLKCDAAIEITASHHPFNRNGLKFFVESGALDSKDIEEILEYAQNEEFPKKSSCGKLEQVDYMKSYAKHLRNIICKGVNAENYDKPLQDLKIVVDAGNGVGGFYAREVWELLGANISGSQFLEPDGYFPNHIPNPENKEAIEAIRNATLKNKADLGVIFDTDVDRAGAVDSSGVEISRNTLVAVCAAIALEGNDGGTIVTDSITSSGVKYFIEEILKGKHHRFKRGYKNVINEARRLNQEGINCPLAIETSGHAALRENYFLDDGAYLITKIIIKFVKLKRSGKSLLDIINKLPQPKDSIEIRLPILDADFKVRGQEIIDKLSESVASKDEFKINDDNYEGIRASFNKGDNTGWFLLRLSVHDPIMPLNVESEKAFGVKEILLELYNILKAEKGIDISKIEEYIKSHDELKA